ncbi:MAG: zinc ABC transporter substrate-binding protein [Planctomycetota bacterium]
MRIDQLPTFINVAWDLLRRTCQPSRMRRRCFATILAMGLLTLGGCSRDSPSDSAADSGKLNVVATVGMVADLVREVGGDQVEVTQICGSGVDPHLYMPTRDDVQKLMDADVIFFCGLKLEGKMADTLERFANEKPVFAVTDAINPATLIGGEEDHADPHLWNDVSLWSQCVGLISDRLSKELPQYAAEFTERASAYQQSLDQLHQYGVDVMKTVPEKSRLLITSHDAFSYFGRGYGLEVRGIQGISTESEAGLQQINGLVDLLLQRNVGAVFVESSVSPKNIEALIEGAASKGHQVVKGGTLFSDAMGAPGSYEGTYIGMLDHNLTTTAKALGGKADGFRARVDE